MLYITHKDQKYKSVELSNQLHPHQQQNHVHIYVEIYVEIIKAFDLCTIGNAQPKRISNQSCALESFHSLAHSPGTTPPRWNIKFCTLQIASIHHTPNSINTPFRILQCSCWSNWEGKYGIALHCGWNWRIKENSNLLENASAGWRRGGGATVGLRWCPSPLLRNSPHKPATAPCTQGGREE